MKKNKNLPEYAGTFYTYSRIKMDVLNPRVNMIILEDIVKGLAYNSHFSGQTPEFFSIAEHCLITEMLVREHHPEDFELRLIALLHDASEAYIGDMIHPIKILFPEFKELENKLQETIMQAFGLPFERMSEIKIYDLAAQDHEAVVFYDSPSNPQYERSSEYVKFLSPDFVRARFEREISQLIEANRQAKQQICYKTNKPCPYNCKGLCKESC